MTDPFRTGYVGAGVLAQKVHLRNLSALPDFDLIALAEARPRLGREVQQRFGIPRLYATHHELAADDELEVVVISGNYADQAEIAIPMLEAGKNVLVEKPMAVSIAQAERLLEAERASQGRLMVAYMKRYDAANVAAKEMIDRCRSTSELGDLMFVRSHNFCGDWLAGTETTPVVRTDEAVPVPVFATPDWLPEALIPKYLSYLQVFTHNVNIVRWLLSAGTDETEAICADFDGDGRTGVVLLSVAGVRTVIESATSRFHAWDDQTHVFFQGGWVKVSAAALLVEDQPSSIEIYRSEAKTLSQPVAPTRWTWPYVEELVHFASCLRTGEPFRSDGQDTLGDVRVFEEIYRLYCRRLELAAAP